VRLVQVAIPEGKRGVVLAVLDDEGIDYVVSDETSNREYEATVAFPLPTNAVESVLADLRDVGVGENAYTVVTTADTVVSDSFDALSEDYAEGGDEDRIAREELQAKAEGLASSLPVYVVMTLVSAVVATAGLLLDSPATVVGSMVIAPVIAPALSASVGTVVDDDELFREGVKLQVLGLGLIVVTSVAFATLIRATGIVPPTLDPTTLSEIEGRLAPNVLSLAVALGAGVAGMVSLTAGVSTALVGVMIAVALVPPAATIGIAIAWGLPNAALGSSVLTLVNLLSINTAALTVLWYQGYRPEPIFQRSQARSATVKRLVVLVGAVALLSVFLGGVTYNSYTSATTEQDIREAVAGVVDDTGGAMLLEVSIRTTNEYVLFTEPEGVVVTAGVTADRPPDLAERIDRAVDRTVDGNIEVQVRYVETETVD